MFKSYVFISGIFFDAKGEEKDNTLEVVSSIPATLLDDCGNEYEFNISLTCSGNHDINENKIESTCTYSAPDVPTCNETTTGTVYDYSISKQRFWVNLK